MKFLLVDDNKDLALGLADVLELEGHSVTVAATASQARKSFAPGQFDYVFLDMKLPDGNGLELYYEFLNRDPDVRLVVMTGFRIEQLLEQVVSDGVVQVLREPFSMEEVNSALKISRPEGIVLVDKGDPEFVPSLLTYLQAAGHKPVVIRDPEDLKKLDQAQSCDVAIVDLKQPVLCGAGIYLNMKESRKAMATIIISAHAPAEPGVSDPFRSMSVTNCLFKPFRPEELLVALNQLRAEPAG